MRTLAKILRRVRGATALAYGIMKCCLVLSCFLAAGALLLLVWEDAQASFVRTLVQLARAMMDTTLPVLFIGTIGSVLVEEQLLR